MLLITDLCKKKAVLSGLDSCFMLWETEEMKENMKNRKSKPDNSYMLCNYLSSRQVDQKIKGEREL